MFGLREKRRGVVGSRIELTENSLNLSQFHFTLLYSPFLPSIQTDHKRSDIIILNALNLLYNKRLFRCCEITFERRHSNSRYSRQIGMLCSKPVTIGQNKLWVDNHPTFNPLTAIWWTFIFRKFEWIRETIKTNELLEKQLLKLS